MSKLEAGRELDALIEQHVFGTPLEAIALGLSNRDLPPQIGPIKTINYVLADYSTSIEAAWEVVEKLKEKNIFIRLSNISGQGKWRCAASNILISDYQETAPMAIAVIALKAMGVTP